MSGPFGIDVLRIGIFHRKLDTPLRAAGEIVRRSIVLRMDAGIIVSTSWSSIVTTQGASA
ncbi:hypothetical protein PO124_09115 [Bacillus licheniformis]|nr:hypothetical protein [Bacillus licheniformis]